MEQHQVGTSVFNLLKMNMRATCLLTHFVFILGTLVKYDDAEMDSSIGDDFMLGLDLQFLLRYCLTIHLSNLKNKG